MKQCGTKAVRDESGDDGDLRDEDNRGGDVRPGSPPEFSGVTGKHMLAAEASARDDGPGHGAQGDEAQGDEAQANEAQVTKHRLMKHRPMKQG